MYMHVHVLIMEKYNEILNDYLITNKNILNSIIV